MSRVNRPRMRSAFAARAGGTAPSEESLSPSAAANAVIDAQDAVPSRRRHTYCDVILGRLPLKTPLKMISMGYCTIDRSSAPNAVRGTTPGKDRWSKD